MKLTDLELAQLGDRNLIRADVVIEIRKRLKKAGLRYCPGCRAVRLFVDFYTTGSYCRKCESGRGQKYYAENREAVTERRSLYRRFTEDRINAMDANAPEPDPSDLLNDANFHDDDDNRY